MDGVMLALGSRGMADEAARQCAKDGKSWHIISIIAYFFNVSVSWIHFYQWINY